MRWWIGWAMVGALLSGCDDGGAEPGIGAGNCDEAALIAQCPPGSNPQLGSIAESQCGGAAGTILSNAEGAAVGNCVGSSVCQVACEWSAPCLCGVASVTGEGVTCQACDPGRGCGNGICDPGESPETCAIDCGARCAPDETRCGSDGVRQSCNLQGVWEDVACPAGEICRFEGGEAICVLDVIGPNPEPEPGAQPEPEPEGVANRCWTFGPDPAPTNGALLGAGDCGDLEWKGISTGPVAPGAEYMVTFGSEGLLRRPLDGVDFAQLDAAMAACEAFHPRIRGEVASRRVPDGYQRDACLHAALVAQCDSAEQGDALFAALDACRAVEEAHLSPADLGLDPETWPFEIFKIHKYSPQARFVVVSWKSYPRERDAPWNLGVADTVAGSFRTLEVPAGYTIEHTRADHLSDWTAFSLDEQIFVAVVTFEGSFNTRALAIWTLETGAVRLVLPELAFPDRGTLHLSPDGRFVIIDHVFIDLETEAEFATFLCAEEVGPFRPPAGMRRTGHYLNAWPLGVEDPELDRVRLGTGVYSPDGTRWLTQGDEGLELWDVATRARLRVLGPGAGAGTPIRMTAGCTHLTIGDQLYGPAE